MPLMQGLTSHSCCRLSRVRLHSFTALQIDNTYNKLQTLCEYIDDTEVGLGLSRGWGWG